MTKANPYSSLIGTQFNLMHSAGVTRYEVLRQHSQDSNYFECKAVERVTGTHTTIGALEVFSTNVIRNTGNNYIILGRKLA